MLRMVDGPVDNLPNGFDAYAGYVNKSGIGITYPAIVAKFPDAIHFSITTNHSPAQCADVEWGAMSSWTGYEYGYCAVSSVNSNIEQYGRPRKLWTAHYDPKLGPHICSPSCWPGLVTTADGTQWTDHGTADYDESLLSDNFFSEPSQQEAEQVTSMVIGGQLHVWGIIANVNYHWWQQAPTGDPAHPANPTVHCEVWAAKATQ